MNDHTLTLKLPSPIKQTSKFAKQTKPKLKVKSTVRDNRTKLDLEVKV